MSETNIDYSQIYKNLEGWEIVRLGDKVELRYGFALTDNKRETGIYPIYGSNGITGYHNRYSVEGPGLIIGRKGSVGAVHYEEEDFWPIDTTYFVSTKCTDQNIKYIYLLLSSLRLKDLATASAVPGLNRDDVYILKVALPPLDEQRQIVEILGEMDAAIAQTELIIKETERLKQALMQELLTRGIGHSEFKQSELGEIPADWEAVKLGDKIEMRYGYALIESKRQDGIYPVYGSNGIAGYHNNYAAKGPGLIVSYQ